jgi:hypothetical protein
MDSLKNLLFILFLGPISIFAQCGFNDGGDCFTNNDGCFNDGQTCDKTEKKYVYPNPTADFFTLESGYTEGVLYAANGQLLRRVNLKKSVDISDLSSGLYFLKVIDTVYKIVKL